MDKREFLVNALNTLRLKHIVKTQKDLCNLIGVDPGTLSKALNGDQRFLSDSLIEKVSNLLESSESAIPADWVKDFPSLDPPSQPIQEDSQKAILPVIPIEAMAGTLGEFASSVSKYDCEMMVSPITGADYAMKVSGDSMSPEYPNGSQILIKKVNEKAFIEWGKVYVLDTDNGAVIKQVRKTEKEGVVECVSLNPDYQPFTIDTSFIHGWYRVLMVLALK